MRHRDQQGLAFFQGFAHQTELEILQIAQTAVKQFGAGRGGCLRQIALFGQRHRQAATHRIPCYSAAVDAAADDEKVDRFGPLLHGQAKSPP